MLVISLTVQTKGKYFFHVINHSGNLTPFAFQLPSDCVGDVGFHSSIMQKIRTSQNSGGFRDAVAGGWL